MITAADIGSFTWPTIVPVVSPKQAIPVNPQNTLAEIYVTSNRRSSMPNLQCRRASALWQV